MGFSVSAATVVILIGILVGLGMAYTAASGAVDLVTDAQNDRTAQALDGKNTAISIANATYENGSTTVKIENEGTTVLSVDQVDVLVDGVYRNHTAMQTGIAGNGTNDETNLWLSGETFVISLETDEQPARVKVVVEHGVADVAEVTAVET